MLQEADGGQTGHPGYRRYHYGYGPLAVVDNTGKRFIQTDALGSPTDLTSTSGAIASIRNYDAWGQYRNDSAPTASDEKLGYTGHQYDPETGLVYARARYYDPELGLFLSRDPLDRSPLSAPFLHRYTWGRGNPLRYVDPTGWEEEELPKTPAMVNPDGTCSDGGCRPEDPVDVKAEERKKQEAARPAAKPDPQDEHLKTANAAAKRSMARAGDATRVKESEEGGVVATLMQVIGKIAKSREDARVAGKEVLKPQIKKGFESTLGQVARAAGGRFRLLPEAKKDVEDRADAMEERVGEEGSEGAVDLVEQGIIILGTKGAEKVALTLRDRYVQAVGELAEMVPSLRASGATPEEVARALHAERRMIGIQFKDMTPPEELERIYKRNLERYGDELGPTIEWLREKGKSWDNIIDSAVRTGGKDLGY